jgi:autotransporter-associated beta strand protein
VSGATTSLVFGTTNQTLLTTNVTTTQDIASPPFLLNSLTLGYNGGDTTERQVIIGVNQMSFVSNGVTNPTIALNGTASGQNKPPLLVFSNAVNFGNDITIGGASGVNFNTITSGAGVVVTKTGAGTMRIAANNPTYTGNFIVTGGNLQIGNNGGLGDAGSGTVTLSGTGAFAVRRAGTSSLMLSNTITGTGNVNFQLGNNSNQTTQVTINKSNTYIGTTTMNPAAANGVGIVNLGVSNGLSTNSVLTIGNTGASVQTFNLAGFNQTLGGLATATGGSATNSRVTLGAGTLTINDGTNCTFAGEISGPGNVVKQGASTWTLSSANTYSGVTTVNAGTLAVSNNLALQNSALNTSGAGTVSLGSGVTTPSFGGLSGTNDLSSVITSNYSLVTGLTLNPGTGVTNTYSGNITNGATSMTLTKTGAGTQILSGTNTYTGATTVSGGTLVVSNSIFTATITSNNISVAFSNTPATNTPIAILSGPLAGGPYSSVTISSPAGYNGTIDTNNGTVSVTSANQKPVVTAGQTFTILENSAANTLLGSLVATDAENNSLSGWAITSGNNLNAFVLDQSTGQLRVMGSLNYEATASYTLLVTVSDGTNTSDPVAVTVNVVNVAEFSDVFGSSDPSADDNGDGISNLMAYALGASSSNSVVNRPLMSVNSSNLTLTALVRTNDPKLQTFGNATLTLSNWPTNLIVGTPTSDQDGAISGVTQKQEFSVERGTDPRKFLRLRATLSP